jgi:hypothetical protein
LVPYGPYAAATWHRSVSEQYFVRAIAEPAIDLGQCRANSGRQCFMRHSGPPGLPACDATSMLVQGAQSCLAAAGCHPSWACPSRSDRCPACAWPPVWGGRWEPAHSIVADDGIREIHDACRALDPADAARERRAFAAWCDRVGRSGRAVHA